MNDFLKDYKRLTTSFYEDRDDSGVPLQELANPMPSTIAPSMYLGGQADLTPLRNKAREASDAMAEAIRAADQGRADDCMEAFRRAKASIDAALGGQLMPGGNVMMMSPVRP